MQFTDADRKFILKIMKSLEDYKKSTDARLSKLEGKDEKVLSPIQRANPPKEDKRFRKDLPFGDPEAGNSIQITFKSGMADAMKQQVLVESLYMTLRQLCDDNDIEQLLIRIEPEL